MDKKATIIKSAVISLFVLIIGFVVILTILPKGITGLFASFGMELSSKNLAVKYSMGIGVRVIGMLLFIPVMLRLSHVKKFTYRIDKKGLLLGWMFYIYILANLDIGNMERATPLLILLMIAESFAIGFYEEILFRGILLRKFVSSFGAGRKNVILSVILTNALFGLIHLINLQSGASAVSVWTQVCYTFMMGIAFSALFLRTNCNLIWCAILHSLYDIAGGFGNFTVVQATSEAIQKSHTADIGAYLLNLLLFLPLLLYAVYLLRKVE